ncbi:hypothetical protein CC80DRAFT_551969 [Byssothecium circinans]|uniref:Uncharacterized protein n=1 Tax=Byssothecium circinans TaxID=147558 RepID=A0A6A5TK07_9PLEO|nr:hypothetical protein CC80DRAFT_551969 [Byssothecium circinans]
MSSKFFQDIHTETIYPTNKLPDTEPFPALPTPQGTPAQQAHAINTHNTAAGLASIVSEQPTPGRPRRFTETGSTVKIWVHWREAERAILQAIAAVRENWGAGADEDEDEDGDEEMDDGGAAHAAFQDSNGSVSPLNAEFGLWIQRSFADPATPFCAVVLAELAAELRALLRLAFCEYVVSDAKLRAVCEDSEEMAERLEGCLVRGAGEGEREREREGGRKRDRSRGLEEAREVTAWLEGMDGEDAELRDLGVVWEVWVAWGEVVEEVVARLDAL